MLASAAALFFVLGPEASAEPETFEERSDVVVVEIPVNVGTRGGAPVRGLTAGDFEIFDNGKPQTIHGFEVVDLEALTVDSADARRAREQLPSTARRHFLLLFDLSFADPSSVLKARTAAREWVLDALHPTDLAAVMIYSLEIGPRLIVTFTPDRAQLARAIDTLGAPALLNPKLQDPLRFVLPPTPRDPGTLGLLDGVETAGSGPLRGALIDSLRFVGLELERSQKAFERSQIKAWARSLGGVARTLDSVAGRKHVVYFSEGFDGTLLLGRQQDRDDELVQQEQLDRERGFLWAVDTDNLYGNSQLMSSIERMLEEFRRADCVIQAVDISGVSAETSGRGRREVGQDALFYIARGTGGELYENANSFGDQLDRMLARTSVTYVLSFQPKDLTLDGSYHRLKVKLKDKPRGTHLSHRSGYYAPRPFEDLHPLEKNLLASDAIASAAPRRDVEVRVLAPAFRTGAANAYVPVIIEIDGPSLLVGHHGDEAEVELYVYVTDDQGRMRDFFTQMVRLDLDPGRAALLDGGFKYYGHLELGPGRYLARVLVRNAATGRTGVETATVEVPAYELGEPTLLPPFFIDTPGRWLLVRAPVDEGADSVVYPFTVDGEPYVPAARAKLSESEAAKLCLVAYNLGPGELRVDARVLDREGRPVPGGRLSRVERTLTGIAGFDKLLTSFRPQGLSPGSYTLEIEVTDPATGTRALGSTAFEVEETLE
ncbi:MAG: VWA domain-containing protein [Thermoanaerobaculia bacterium]